MSLACTEADLASVASVSETLLPPFWHWANTDFQHSNWNKINYVDQERIVNVVNAGLKEFCLMLRHFTFFYYVTGKKEKKRVITSHQNFSAIPSPSRTLGLLRKDLGQTMIVISGVCTLYIFDCLLGQRSEILSRHF